MKEEGIQNTEARIQNEECRRRRVIASDSCLLTPESSPQDDNFLVRLAKSIRISVEPGRHPKIMITGGTDF